MKKSCYKCSHFNNCFEEGMMNLDKFIDKRIERKFMRECDFRYCKKFKFLKSYQKDNLEWINEHNSIIASSLGVTYIPVEVD